MFDSRNGWFGDPLLRMAGLVMLGGCWLLMSWLFHQANLREHQDPTFVEFAAAAVGFLCLSAGAALATIGAHVFDQVEISERWARRSYFPSRSNRTPFSPAFLIGRDQDLIAALSKKAADEASARPATTPVSRS